MSGSPLPPGVPRLWIRPTPQRSVLVAHLRSVAAAFVAAGWDVHRGPTAPPPDPATLAVLDDPWCEPTPELAARLAAARGRAPGRWRVPRVTGLSGPQGWHPTAPPWTRWEYRRLHLRGRTGVATPLSGRVWTGFAVAPARPAATPAPTWPPGGDDVELVSGAVLFRHADPAGHERRELDELIPPTAALVVDVGCGRGLLGARLRRAGSTVIGIEPDPELAAAARGALDRVIETTAARAFEELPDEVDCFVFADVLEHMTDPVGVLLAARDRLAEGGVIVASLPNVGFAPIVRAAAAGRWDTTLAGVQARDHLFFTTPASFAEIAAGCGLEVVERRLLTAPVGRRTRLWAWLTARLLGGDAEAACAPQAIFVLRRR